MELIKEIYKVTLHCVKLIIAVIVAFALLQVFGYIYEYIHLQRERNKPSCIHNYAAFCGHRWREQTDLLSELTKAG